MTEKNTNRMAIGLCLLMVANLHNEALDFQGAKENCEKVFDLGVEKDPFNFFIGHGILAIAYLGLQDYPAAWEQIDQLIHRIEVDGIAMDTVIYPLFYHTVCDYCLAVGDLPRAREQAMRMYEITAPPPELHYLALAHRQLSRVAMGEGDLEDAKSELERAISIVEQGNFPLAAWRVYLTAFEVYNRIGDTDSANEHLHCAEKVIATLAENFDEDDPLRASLMKGFAAELRYLRSPGPVSECC